MKAEECCEVYTVLTEWALAALSLRDHSGDDNFTNFITYSRARYRRQYRGAVLALTMGENPKGPGRHFHLKALLISF